MLGVKIREMFRSILIALALTSALSSYAQQPVDMRVMSYNLEWFTDGATPERLANINSVIGNIKPNVIGLMEINGKKAMEELFPASSDWTFGIQDDPNEPQELAIAVRKPFKLVNWELVFSRPIFNPMFPNRRDVLRALVEAPNGRQVLVYVVHTKSRSGGRMQTDIQRESAAGMFAGFLYGMSAAEPDYTIIGDFNDSPEDRSVNILESGDLNAPAGPNSNYKIAFNLADDLYRKDYVTHGLERLFKGQDMEPIAAGAAAANDEVRGKEHRFPQDVKVTQILFDQILVSPKLKNEVKGGLNIYSKADSIRGKGPRVKVTDQGDARIVEYTDKGTQASDHQPIYFDLTLKPVEIPNRSGN